MSNFERRFELLSQETQCEIPFADSFTRGQVPLIQRAGTVIKPTQMLFNRNSSI